MSLYNCKSDGDQYRISKFTNDLDVEASYLTDGTECDCPAGHRPVCRHRIMLVRFIAKNATAGQWFHNYEHDQWIRALAENEPDTLGDLASVASELTIATSVSFPDDVSGDELANAFAGLMHQPNDTKMLESIRQSCLGNEPKPINLLELAKPSVEPYGISPMITHDLPIIQAHNNATHERLVRAEQTRIEPKPLRRL